jgi:hypothetical protein
MEWGVVEPILARRPLGANRASCSELHQKALAAIEGGTLALSSRCRASQFPNYELGNISINSFAMFGKDMHECNVAADEETYLSMRRPQAWAPNARCGDAIVIHFAYHTQTEFMDKSGMLLGLREPRRAAPVPHCPRLRQQIARTTSSTSSTSALCRCSRQLQRQQSSFAHRAQSARDDA